MNHAFRSTWGALLWKEWRQQCLPFLFLACFCLVGYLGYCQSAGGRPEPTGWFVLLILAAICLAANGFAAEGDDRTDTFLAGLPLSRWRMLVVKYPIALGLAFVCMILPSLVLRPAFGQVFAGMLSKSIWSALHPTVAIFLATSAVVAIGGVLAGHGVGAMWTLLGTGVLGVALGVVVANVGYPFALVAGGLRTHYFTAAFAPWCVVHLWLGGVWLRRHRSRQLWWRLGLWACLLPVASVLPSAALIGYQRVLMGPRAYIVRGRFEAIPSPNGRTIALTTRRYDHGSSLGGAATWLLDADTGRTRRIGPRWRDCRFGLHPADRNCWSPDGALARLYVSPVPMNRRHIGWLTPEELLALTDERLVHVEEGTGTLGPGRPKYAYRYSSWLADGTRATFTPDAWIFTDPQTGYETSCVHPPEDDPLDGRWHRTTAHWLDSAIVKLNFEWQEGNTYVLHLWRSAPGLPQAERRDIQFDKEGRRSARRRLSSMRMGPYAVAFSPDGNWLLVDDALRLPRQYLISLVDGATHPLPPEVGARYRSGMFTPDSRLLVIPCTELLHVWNLAEGKWEPGTRVPVEARLRLSPNDIDTPAYAISPDRPWRVALSAPAPGAVYVVDIEAGTATRVFRGGRVVPWHSQPPWFGAQRLLLKTRKHHAERLWVVEADGSGSRQVLP
ncbi:MAG: ABC transporter permease [Victivallales bacterium]|nr:ABC transporter permease [Victivallales bacterium]